jgi:hypothetical protein
VRIDGYHVRHATLDPATYELLEGAPLRPDEAIGS